jgi:intracellular sulfur oxidation DsrE/DsrF family protein
MKKTLLIIALMLNANFLFAQKKPFNIVFDITSKDTIDHKLVLHWIKEITENHPDANIEVVFYSKSLSMITTDKSTVADQVKEFAKKPNVAFRVCEIAMKNNNVAKSQLLPGVGTVPDGLYELVMKQQDGWGYIKVSH